jgi:hypothetical protein
LTIKRGGMNAIYDEMVRTKVKQQTASAANPDRAVASA